MRAIIVAVFVVGGQYQCFEASGVAQVTARSNKMGEQGWELVTSAGSATSTLWCFKRPLWKK